MPKWKGASGNAYLEKGHRLSWSNPAYSPALLICALSSFLQYIGLPSRNSCLDLSEQARAPSKKINSGHALKVSHCIF
jgi:hypothetical protein